MNVQTLRGAWAWLLTLVIVFAPGGAAQSAQAGELPSAAPRRVQVEQVAPHTWVAQGSSALGTPANRNFISNATFIVDDDGVIVFDALGAPVLAEELLAEIRRITPAPIRYLVLTHYHADHVYGAQVFQAAGAIVVAQRQGAVSLNADTAAQRLVASRELLAPWIDAHTRLVPADLWIDAPTSLRVGKLEVQLIPAGPAHTPEDLVAWVPQLGVLVAGDLMFRGRVPYVGQADSRRWIASLDTLLAFDAKVVITGHGPPSTDVQSDLRLTRDYLRYLRQSMAQAARELTPFEEAYRQTDWSAFTHLPLFEAANRINAYNAYLLMEQQPEPVP